MIHGGHSKRSVMDALSQVLASRYFADSQQLSDFLRYIVTKTLDGQEEEIKAYTIAVDALGRSEDFDPQTNAAVRVAAGRLRQNLALYNADPTSTHAVKITLAPGSYVPTFLGEPNPDDLSSASIGNRQDAKNVSELSQDTDSAHATAAPDFSPVIKEERSREAVNPLKRGLVSIAIIVVFIAVLWLASEGENIRKGGQQIQPNADQTGSAAIPSGGSVQDLLDIDIRPTIRITWNASDNSYPKWFRAGPIIGSLSVVLARFDDYEFKGINVTSGLDWSTPESGNSDYHLVIRSYRRGEHVRMFGQLFDEQTSRVIWSDEQLFSENEDGEPTNLPAAVGRLVAPLMSPYGVVYSSLSKNIEARENLDCVVAALRYFNSESDEGHKIARSCAEEKIEAGSRSSTIHAYLTFLYLDEHRADRNRRERDPLAAAMQAARRAVELAPSSARAHQALFAVQKVMGLCEQARESVQKALELNPYDMDILADYAAWLVSIGETKEGQKALATVEDMISARPAWLEFFRFLAAELDDDFEKADAVASLFDIRRSSLMAIAVAISSQRKGDSLRARRALDQLTRSDPNFLADPASSLMARGFDESVAQRLINKLKIAGLEVNSDP